MATNPYNQNAKYDDEDVPLGIKHPQYSPMYGSNTSSYQAAGNDPSQPPPYYTPAEQALRSPDTDYTSYPPDKPSDQSFASSSSPRASPYAPPLSDSPSPSAPKKGGVLSKLATPDLLNPPPPSFARAPRPGFAYGPFAPHALQSTHSSLRRGFPAAPPPPLAFAASPEAHPFATHDVAEEDWLRFAGDVQRAAKLSIAEHVVAGAVPALFGISIVGAIAVSQGIEYGMRRKKRRAAAALVEEWNRRFFHPRMIDVYLVRGRTVYTGAGTVPIELTQLGYARADDAHESVASSSSEDEDAAAAAGPSAGTKADKQSKGKQKQKRKEKAKEKRNSGPWKLVVVYKSPAAQPQPFSHSVI